MDMTEMTTNESCRALAERLVEEYRGRQNQAVLTSVHKRRTPGLAYGRDQIEEEIRKEIRTSLDAEGDGPASDYEEQILAIVRSELWGYGILDPLIRDDAVSDIKLYGKDRIRIKQTGRRMDAGIRFASDQEYRAFLMRILERNKINLGTANAIQTFTDASQDTAILRITAISVLLTDSQDPCFAIRKIPRQKNTLETLWRKGMFDRPRSGNAESGFLTAKDPLNTEAPLIKLLHDMIRSRGILFTGKGASGKTTLMNAMLSEIPKDESVMICQENAELFDVEHPDLLTVHVMNHGADSKVAYTLGDLTRAALLMDLDRVIVGEVKEGSEAAGLSKASMTGHKCWTSVHGENCRMAIEKMADYIAQATGCHSADARKQLTGFEYVVHLRQFQVDEVVRIDGWDRQNEDLSLTELYPERKEIKLEKEWWEP